MENDQMTISKNSQISCSEVEQHLDRYLEGELSVRENFLVDRHLCSCTRCCQMVDELNAVIDLAASLADRPVPADVSQRLRTRLQEETGLRFSRPKPVLSLVK